MHAGFQEDIPAIVTGMETLILWLGFFGAWLLFAGPIYQAALELHEQDIETDRIRATGKNVISPKKVSAWWWLFPPAKVVLERRRSRAYRRAYIEALIPEDVEALTSFFNKARAWFFVAAGGFFIAMKETYELVEARHWTDRTFWIIILIAAFISIINTTSRLAKTREVLTQKKK